MYTHADREEGGGGHRGVYIDPPAKFKVLLFIKLPKI